MGESCDLPDEGAFLGDPLRLPPYFDSKLRPDQALNHTSLSTKFQNLWIDYL